MHFQQHPKFKINYLTSEVKEKVTPFIESFFDDSEIIKLQTSGSTGKPKIIEVKKEFMINSAKATGNFFGLIEGTKALLCMNPNYVGAKMMIVRALMLGWELDVVEPSRIPLKDVAGQYDFCAMVPLQVSNSLNDLDKISQLIIGGGVVSNDLKTQLQSVSTLCFATYGMTETVSHIALMKLNHFQMDTEGDGSEYNLLSNISISQDDRNCLIIKAPKIASEEIVTNDIVEIISENKFKWLGRFDNIINSGGVKLVPEEIEKKLSEIIDTTFFVAGIPDAELGEKLVLIVEGEHDKNVILSQVKSLATLNKYEIPKEVYAVSVFIKTETKKIQRKKTLDLLSL